MTAGSEDPAAATVRELDSDGLEALVAEARVPVFVDFWSQFCAPCATVAPVMDELAVEFADQVIVGTVDVVANPDAAARHHISSVPALVIFIDGEPVRRIVGGRPKAHLVRELREAMGRSGNVEDPNTGQ